MVQLSREIRLASNEGRLTETPTPAQSYRADHGAPAGWCGAEIDEYLAACDATLAQQ